jgi:hypothetical protein
MAASVDPELISYYNVTFILCACVFCEDCKREIKYTSLHPRFTDENYYDAATAMAAEGWVVATDGVSAFCPACAAKRGIRVVK